MKIFSKIALFLFGLIAILHVLRLIYGVEVKIGSCQVPVWMSYGGFLLFFILFIGMWNELKPKK
jgi:hypothetical protein